MYPRTNYEMTKADLDKLLESMKATPCIMVGSYIGSSQQERANMAWAELGKTMGFDPMTVEPIRGKGNLFFSAIPAENDVQREERLAREAEEQLRAKVEKLELEIKERQEQLSALLA